MARDLKNKVIVVTGGADGIGLEIADRYLERNAKVTILLDINEDQGEKAAENLCSKYGANKALFIKCDVTKDLDAVSNKIIDLYKTVDVLVNNAGVVCEQDSKKTMAVNVVAVIDWSLKFWEHMRTDKGGKGGTIVNMSSMYGFKVTQYLPIYRASKFAVMGFTKSLGHTYNFNRSGIRVVAICPGFTETKLTETFHHWDDENVRDDFNTYLKTELCQKVDSVGKAAVEVFEKTDSGTAWFVEGGKAIVEV